MSALRSASNRWGPKYEIKKEARTARGIYTCAGYQRNSHSVPASVVVNGRRVSNAVVDHVSPVIDPQVGFISWDSVVERLFIEKPGLQLLCKECHDHKSSDERIERKNIH